MKKHDGQSDHVNVYRYGLDVRGRMIFMSMSADHDVGTIDSTMADHVLKALYILTRKGEKDRNKPITIVMNSPGGELYEGRAIYDALRKCRAPITVVVFGKAMSAASMILQAADRRLLGPQATLMLHYGESGRWGNSDPERLKSERAEERRLISFMKKVYMQRMAEKDTRISKKNLQKKVHELLSNETYLSARQAIRYGLADRITSYYPS